MKSINPEDLTVEELKALAFDTIIARDNANQQLQIITAELDKRASKPVKANTAK